MFLAACYIWRNGYAAFNGVNNDAAKFFNGNHKAKEIQNFEIKLKSNDRQNLKTRRT